MAAGDFTCSVFQAIQDRLEAIGLDSNVNKDYIVDNEAVKEIYARQTASIVPLETRRGASSIKVSWVKTCVDTVTDPCPTTCSFDYPELETACQTYSIGECASTGFSVLDSQFRDNIHSREEVVARGLAQADKILAEDHAAKLYAKMAACGGVLSGTDDCDDFTNGVLISDLTNGTAVTGSLWNYNLYPHLMKFMRLNRMPSSSFILADGSMYTHWLNTQFNQVQPNDAAQARKIGAIPTFFDLFSFDTAFTDSRLILADPGSYLAITTYDPIEYPSTPVTYGNGADITKFSIPSLNIPGATLEVDYRTTCETNKDIKHIWEITLRWDYFCAPTSCDTDNTGIFQFVCGDSATVLS